MVPNPLMDLMSDYAKSLLHVRRWADASKVASETTTMKPDYVKVGCQLMLLFFALFFFSI